MELKVVRIYGTPNAPVKNSDTDTVWFKFDNNGHFLTIDKDLAKRAAVHFRCEELIFVEKTDKPVEVSPVGQRATDSDAKQGGRAMGRSPQATQHNVLGNKGKVAK